MDFWNVFFVLKQNVRRFTLDFWNVLFVLKKKVRTFTLDFWNVLVVLKTKVPNTATPKQWMTENGEKEKKKNRHTERPNSL